MKRPLHPEEHRLWSQVAATIHPLPGRASAAAESAPSPGIHLGPEPPLRTPPPPAATLRPCFLASRRTNLTARPCSS